MRRFLKLLRKSKAEQKEFRNKLDESRFCRKINLKKVKLKH